LSDGDGSATALEPKSPPVTIQTENRSLIYRGDALAVLRTLPAESVHCCVTSPPYWGLRDYGVNGQLGLERTPEEYVSRMVEVFREVRRVLRSDGTLWLNLGDSYAGSGPSGASYQSKTTVARNGKTRDGNFSISRTLSDRGLTYTDKKPIPPPGLKPKDLVGIPWSVALALRADGWYLRSDIIWSKPNPMPESVTDRPTKAHEYLFLLAKSERYYYDADAIKEPSISGDPRKPYAPGQVDARGNGHNRNGGKIRPSVARGNFNGKTEALAEQGRNAFRATEDWRNRRTVWTIVPQPFKGAHFAVFPEKLVEPCILAGCQEDDTILDPFCGSGTVGVVALRHNRQFIGIELSRDYCEMARQRIDQSREIANG
jgi:DNA modification methylase